jgi:Fur family peroxide stress response transcriptional regulator
VSSEVELRLRDLEAACRRAGARVTHQRREILRTLVESDDHPDAQAVLEDVRERVPTISFDTVYRTLSFLERQGLIRRLRAGGDRARFDGARAPHHHFICTQCGRILDFESEELDRMELPAEVVRLGSVEAQQLQVFGMCHECSERRKRRNAQEGREEAPDDGGRDSGR